jgi:hypothetical protein
MVILFNAFCLFCLVNINFKGTYGFREAKEGVWGNVVLPVVLPTLCESDSHNTNKNQPI